MGGKLARQQELSGSKERARLLADQFDHTVKRGRQIGSLVLGRARRRPVGFGAVSAGILALYLIRRATASKRRRF